MLLLKRPSQIYYGWWMVGALAFTETISYGVVYYTFAVFIGAMETDLGWSRSVIAGAYSLALLVMGLTAVPVGIWLDRHGARGLMTVGSCAAALLVFAWSQVTSVPIFYAIWAALGVTMAATFYEPAFVVAAQWFGRQRSQALSLITFVAGFASTIFIPLAEWLLRTQGWRSAIVTLGLILACGTIPLHALVLRRFPRDHGLHPDGLKPEGGQHQIKPTPKVAISWQMAVRSPAFWWLTMAFSLSYLVTTAMVFHLIPYLTGQGYSISRAALFAGLIGAMKFPGRLAFAPLEARLSSRGMAAALFVTQAVALLVLGLFHSLIGVLLFVFLFGAAIGAITLARPALLADLYGPTQYGKISSVVVLALTIPHTLAPVGAGILYVWFGSYEPVLWLLTIIALAAGGAVLMARANQSHHLNQG
jgi:MFS family permease